MIRMIKNPFAVSAARNTQTESLEFRRPTIEGSGTG
jgi:hypothetical protein